MAPEFSIILHPNHRQVLSFKIYFRFKFFVFFPPESFCDRKFDLTTLIFEICVVIAYQNLTIGKCMKSG